VDESASSAAPVAATVLLATIPTPVDSLAALPASADAVPGRLPVPPAQPASSEPSNTSALPRNPKFDIGLLTKQHAKAACEAFNEDSMPPAGYRLTVSVHKKS
jgi:hypothetical protein